MKKTALFLLLFALSFAIHAQPSAVKTHIQKVKKIRKALAETIRQSKDEPHVINVMEINLRSRSPEGEIIQEKVKCFFGLEWESTLKERGIETAGIPGCKFIYFPYLIRREWSVENEKFTYEYLFDSSDTPHLIHAHYAVTDLATGAPHQEVHNYYNNDGLLWGESREFDPETHQVVLTTESVSIDSDLTGAAFELRFATLFAETLQKLACNIR